MFNQFRFLFVLIVLLLAQGLKSQIVNIEKERLEQDTVGWAGSISLGGNYINNKEKEILSLSGGLHVQYKTKKSIFLILSDYSQVRTSGEDFDNKAFGHFRYSYKINKSFTWESFVQSQYNKVLKVNFRQLTGTGVRIKLVDKKKFNSFLGMLYMYEYEEVDGDEVLVYNRDHRMSNYLSLKTKLFKKLSFNSVTYYQPNLSMFGDYRVSSQNSISIDLSGKFSYSLVYNLLFDSHPPEGVATTTYSILNGIKYKL